MYFASSTQRCASELLKGFKLASVRSLLAKGEEGKSAPIRPGRKKLLIAGNPVRESLAGMFLTNRVTRVVKQSHSWIHS